MGEQNQYPSLDDLRRMFASEYGVPEAGGGLIGASIAFELAEAGMKVALYDALN